MVPLLLVLAGCERSQLPKLEVNSSVTCTACQSLLTLAVWQGEKWSEEVTPGFYCSLQPNDCMFLFPFRNPALPGAPFCKMLSPTERSECSYSPNGHGEHWECPTHFRNGKHLPVLDLAEMAPEQPNVLHLDQPVLLNDMSEFIMLDMSLLLL